MNKPFLSPLHHFYRTSSQPCPYLDGFVERKVITEVSGPAPQPLYNDLSRAGFRRSHQLAYRPACPACTACVPVRVAVNGFVPGRSIRRLEALNADLRVETVEASGTVEQYRLFTRYQLARHAESDMASMGFGDYRAMIEDSPVATVLVTLRDRTGRLVGVCLTDDLDDGASAVYSFYDPDQPKRSLGTWLVVALIERARRLGRPYVYLGYWIAGSRKMAYKTRFRPLEALSAGGWQPFHPD
ncbi:putative arginyl-tRNA--protein transferase [Aliidongia dinghuensis]|uniref:Aspartate/glutamate leucyltransferase n=1 Tax=Aliidongia dinghuensis TaxID=1867774 RepID=A0A8J2YYH1_9PROT|nr:arginyltransferase [Aliidongia dinghuensis]GGF40951.1 putative arginyl-tRNA--protein transferase [Aliidongia dinghuensis]